MSMLGSVLQCFPFQRAILVKKKRLLILTFLCKMLKEENTMYSQTFRSFNFVCGLSVILELYVKKNQLIVDNLIITQSTLIKCEFCDYASMLLLF